MTNIIQYLVFSDVHFGHRRTKTAQIVEHFNTLFSSNKQWAQDLDIIFIAGDLFDRKLDMGSPDAMWSISFIFKLARFCADNDIILRILEGTPDHDWHQASIFEPLFNKAELKLNYRYIDTLQLEYIERYDRHILYIPDKWDTPENTYSQVQTLLKENGLTMVDITIMHGQFHFQLPHLKLASSHTEENYIKITRGLIHPGHIHKHRHYDKIVVQGSFDRLAQNEEEPKGCVLVTASKDKYDWRFIENKQATIYKTIDINTSDSNEINDILKKSIPKYPKGSYIRLRVPQASPAPAILSDIRKSYLSYHIDYIYDKVTDTQVNDTVKLASDKEYVSLQITEENISRLLWDRCSAAISDKALFDSELNSVI